MKQLMNIFAGIGLTIAGLTAVPAVRIVTTGRVRIMTTAAGTTGDTMTTVAAGTIGAAGTIVAHGTTVVEGTTAAVGTRVVTVATAIAANGSFPAGRAKPRRWASIIAARAVT
jgi:hypothetical protein